MPSVQPNRLVPGRHGHASAAAASAYAARNAAPALRLVPPPGEADGVRAARRHRESVIAQDQATYQCGCGKHFTAAVSTTVDCPACGTDQAW